jgi:hypothetical protein
VRQDVPFVADRCHQLRVSRTAETTTFTPETRHNASNCLMNRQSGSGECSASTLIGRPMLAHRVPEGLHVVVSPLRCVTFTTFACSQTQGR